MKQKLRTPPCRSLLLEGRPQPYSSGRPGRPDPRFPASMPVGTYDLLPFVPPRERTGDLIHAFYTEQAQIHGGAMDRFVAGSTNPGLVLGFYDATSLPEGKLAMEFVLFDHCFHSAFGRILPEPSMADRRSHPAWRRRCPARLAFTGCR